TSGSVLPGGGVSTVIPIWLVALCPNRSVTPAVIVCAPAPRALVVTLAPVPSVPARFERHAMAALRSAPLPSCAVPRSVTGSPTKNVPPFGGCWIVTVGFGGVTTVSSRMGFWPLVADDELYDTPDEFVLSIANA